LGLEDQLSSSNDVPMWLKEQLARFEQLQQNLQSILMQKQQVDMEKTEVDRALAEIKKAADGDAIYKSSGSVLIRANKDELVKDLEEKKELSSTRSTVLSKQEQRVRENIKELQAKIEESVKSKGPAQTSAPSFEPPS
jgi:prefoldin beta subunit